MLSVTKMNTNLSLANPAQVETECLVVLALDYGEKDKNEPRLQTSDSALKAAVSEMFASGEFSGKLFETLLLHHPQGLKAKRLLLIGGGKAKNFTALELRKASGTAVRSLKPKGIRSFAFALPNAMDLPQTRNASGEPQAEAGPEATVKAIVEGAYVANFDADR
jgi:leucyl aminopeptidase